MDILKEKVENQVQFWSLLGPFLMLLSIVILLFKSSIHWYFPLSLLVGIPLCVKWKMKGMVAALSCLFLLSFFVYLNLEWDERYWHVGMALAMAFSFIVLTLSLEEVQGLIQKLQVESHSRLDNFLRMDEKWQFAEKEWGIEKEKREAQTAALTQQVAQIAEEKQTFYKLAQLAKDELLQMRNQYDLLRQELIYKNQEVANLYERIEQTEMTLQDFINSNAEKQIKELTDQVACLQREGEEGQLLLASKQVQWEKVLQEKKALEYVLESEKERNQFLLTEGKSQKQKLVEQDIQYKKEAQNAQLQIKTLEDIQQKDQQACKRLTEELEVKHQREQEKRRLCEKERGEITLQHQEKCLLLDQQIKATQESYQSILGAYKIAQTELELKSERLSLLQQEREQLHHQLQEHQILVGKKEEQFQQVENLKLELQLHLEGCQAELDSLKQQLEASKAYREQLPYAPGNTRALEAMYIQLKQQFEEKAEILNATRRELFKAQEESMKWQKEDEEKRLFEFSEVERDWQAHLLACGRHAEQMEETYEKEIAHLSRLIDALFCQSFA